MAALNGAVLSNAEILALVRPYTRPLTRSVGANVGRHIPSRSGGHEHPAQHFATEDGNNGWSPYLDHCGTRQPLQSSGPMRGLPTRPAIGTGYATPSALWNLAGVASSFLQVIKAPRQTTKVAIGRWTPFASASKPLPTLPEPARMVQPYR